jgi:hypothetical protein
MTDNELADAWDDLAEAAAALALQVRRTAPPDAPQAALTTETVENLPFDDFEDTPRGRSAAGGCPIHGLPWSVREAGISKKTGEPYRAFYKCDGQNADGSYCNERPSPSWVKAHPIRGIG